MNTYNVSMLKAILVLLCLLSGCTSPLPTQYGRVDRIEIYYRDYNVLSPIQFSEKQLIKSADVRLVVTDEQQISEFLNVIDIDCKTDATVIEDRMDLHLLARGYNDHKLVWSWKASKFHFLQSSQNSACKLGSADRDRTKMIVQRLAVSAHNSPADSGGGNN